MSDSTIPSGSSNPLVSRMDRLDFIMKYLERRTKFEGLESNNVSSLYGGVVVDRNGRVPMDLALKEVQFKGPLVDRVAALESRLYQLRSDMESSGTSWASSSGASSSQTSGDTSSHPSRGEPSCSLPTFNHPKLNYGHTRISQVHVMSATHEIEEKSDREEQNLHPINPPKQKHKENKPKKDEKSSKTGKKKRVRPSWPRFRLLGCN